MKNKLGLNLRRPEVSFLFFIAKLILSATISALIMEYLVQPNISNTATMVPFFACIGVLVTTPADHDDNILHMVMRGVAILSAGLFALLIGSLTRSIPLISLGILPYLFLLYFLGRLDCLITGGSFYFATMYITTAENLVPYTFNRGLGVAIGMVVGILIHLAFRPLERRYTPPPEERTES